MRIPETENIHYQYAFKKGYRMAVDGKSMNHMPSDIRRDMELRQYFQEGWEQAVEDVTLAQQEMKKPDWRHRFIWFAVMVLGGIATAAHLISSIEEEKAEQQAILSPEPETTHGLLSSEHLAIQSNDQPLSLLSETQRRDIQLNQTEPTEPLPLEELVASPIQIKQAIITNQIENRSPAQQFDEKIPKYIRELYFYTEVDSANGQTIFHRWRTETQILATIKLEIGSDKFRTWSSKKMSSAWQGRWYLEVLDENKDVIYRKSFIYGN